MVKYLEIKVENRRKMCVNGKRNTFTVWLNCTNQSATSIDSSCHCDHKNQSQQNLHFTKKIHCLVNQLLLKWERKYFLCHILKYHGQLFLQYIRYFSSETEKLSLYARTKQSMNGFKHQTSQKLVPSIKYLWHIFIFNMVSKTARVCVCVCVCVCVRVRVHVLVYVCDNVIYLWAHYWNNWY